MAHGSTLDSQILSIVQSQSIREQQEIQRSLENKGYKIPQATLSRKLKKLNIIKVKGVYKVVDLHLPNSPPILNIRESDMGFVVLHTYPGHASALAYIIDQKYVAYSPQDCKGNKNGTIIGTIAGDDTVLILLKSKDEMSEVIENLSESLGYPKSLLNTF